MAFAVEGTYDVLSIVDQTHLDCAVVDERTKVPLGWSVTIVYPLTDSTYLVITQGPTK